MPLSATRALIQLGGIAPVRDVVALSSRRKLRTALAGGRIHRVTGRPWVVLADPDRATRAARSHGGVVSHLSAALHHHWKVLVAPEMPQLTVRPRDRWPQEPEEVAERFERHLRPHQVSGSFTTPLQTVLDCARDLPFGEALAVADSALRSRAVTHDELVAAARRTKGPGRARTLRVAELADGRAANPLESALRALCIEAGLAVVPQWEVRVSDKLTLHPDLANPILGLAIEAESWEHHGKHKPDFESDCERYDELVALGWRVLRFTYDQVTRRPAWVVRVIRATAAACQQEGPRHAG